MKIAVFHNLPFGGAKRVLYEEIKALSKKNEVYLYQLSGERDNVFNLMKYVKEFHEYGFTPKNHLPAFLNRLYSDHKKLFALRKVHKNIAEDIDTSNFDVVLIHPDYYTQAPFILRYLKTKKVYYCHELLRIAYEKNLGFDKDVIFFKKWYESTIRALMKNIDKTNARFAEVILTNSLHTKQNIKMAYGRDSSVCYPGVDSDFFKPVGGLAKNSILFVGDEEKILGQGFEKMLGKNLQGKYKIEKMVRNKDNGDDYLRQLYNRALVTVCLTQNEPFGMVPLESMSCGTPVIALDDGGYRETIINGKTGFLIGKNASRIQNRIEYFVLNPSDADKIGKVGRNYVESEFTWGNHIRILEKAIRL